MPTPPELLLISAMLRTKDHVLPASRGISSTMFHAYKEEFEWIEDYVTMHGRTPSTGAFRAAFDEVPLKKVDDVEYFCGLVRENHSSKVVTKGLHDIIAKIRSGDVSGAIKQLNSAAVAAEASLIGHNADGDIFRDYDDITNEVLSRKKKHKATGFAGIPTGFPTLDELTSGIQPGWFVVITARAGVGKTRSLIRMACAAAFSGYTVQYDALEQNRPEIAMQVHSFTSSEFGHDVFKSLDLAQGNGFETGKYLKFLQDMRTKVQGKMHVADTRRGPITQTTMCAQIERNKVDALFLDYLTLVDGIEDHQSAANLSSALKRMAGRYNIPVITAAQINRTGASKSVQGLEDIGVSDRIGQDADLVINVQKFSKNVVTMRVTKFRHGPDGQVFYLKFDPNMGVMEEITYEQAMDLKDIDEEREERQKERKFVPRKKGSFHEAALAVKSAKKSETAESHAKPRSRADRVVAPKTASRAPQRRPAARGEGVRLKRRV